MTRFVRLTHQFPTDRLLARPLLVSAAAHRLRHLMLFRALHELVGDWVSQTPAAGIHRPLRDLVHWARRQAQQPTQSPLPLWHDEADFRQSTREHYRAHRRRLLLAAALPLTLAFAAALLFLLGNF